MSTLNEQAEPGFANFQRYKAMRDSTPVWREPESGSWHVYGYDDIVRILSDVHTFSSDFGQVLPDRSGPDSLAEGNIIALDPPRHDQLRSLVSLAFTPRAIAHLEGRIAELTESLLDAVDGLSDFELVRDLAYPLPVVGAGRSPREWVRLSASAWSLLSRTDRGKRLSSVAALTAWAGASCTVSSSLRSSRRRGTKVCQRGSCSSGPTRVSRAAGLCGTALR